MKKTRILTLTAIFLFCVSLLFTSCNTTFSQSQIQSAENSQADDKVAQVKNNEGIEEVCSIVFFDSESNLFEMLTVPKGEPFVFPNNTNAPIGHTFKGWINSRTGQLHQSGEYTVLTQNETFFTKFEKQKMTLSFPQTSIETDYGSVVVLPVIPEKIGYFGNFWKDSKGNTFSPQSSYIVEKNESFIPVYQPKTVLVEFENGGGSGKMEDIEANFGDEALIPACVFSRAKYIFVGWKTPEGRICEPGDKYTICKEGPIILTAVWTPKKEITLSVNDLIEGSALYEIDLNKYVDTNALISSGYTSYRITVSFQSTKTSGICYPGFELFASKPEINRNVFLMDHRQVQTYAANGRVAKEDLQWGTTTYTTELLAYKGQGKIYLHVLARAAILGDMFSNEFQLSGHITIQFY